VRFNASLRVMARAAYFDSAYQWDAWLPLIEFFYAARPQAGLAGDSPFFLDTGRTPRMPWDLVYAPDDPDPPSPAAEEVELRIAHLHRAWRAAQAELDQRERRREEARAAKYRPAPTFQVGDRVLILRPPGWSGSKMEFPHFGPFIVKECLERDRYRLTDAHGWPLGKHDVFHVRRLKRMPALSREAIIDAGQQYEVEKIVAHRYSRARGCREYRLRYSHYSAADDSWEPASPLNGPALDMLDEYLTKHGLSGRAAEDPPAEPSPTGNATPPPPPSPGDGAPPSSPVARDQPVAHSKAARDERRARRAADREVRLGATGG
jgi:hypothetical protein